MAALLGRLTSLIPSRNNGVNTWRGWNSFSNWMVHRRGQSSQATCYPPFSYGSSAKPIAAKPLIPNEADQEIIWGASCHTYWPTLQPAAIRGQYATILFWLQVEKDRRIRSSISCITSPKFVTTELSWTKCSGTDSYGV